MMSLRRQLVLGAALACLLLAFFLWGLDLHALSEAFRRASVLPLAALVGVSLATYYLRALRWGDLLAPLARVARIDLFSATMVGFAASLLVPRSGEVVRPWLISRRHPVPASAAFATIVIERLLDLLCVLVLFAMYLFAFPPPPAQADGGLLAALTLGATVAGMAAAGAIALLLALHANAERAARSLELLARGPGWLTQPLRRLVRAFSSGLVVLRTPAAHLGKLALQSAAIWLLTALAYHLVHVAFGIALPFHATFLVIALLVVGEAIPTPGLVGSFHAFYLLAVGKVYGVDHATAAAAGVVAHALMNLPVLMVGLAMLGREGLSVARLVRIRTAGR